MGDAPQGGNKLGGGENDIMSGSGAWATNEIDEITPPVRPISLQIQTDNTIKGLNLFFY